MTQCTRELKAEVIYIGYDILVYTPLPWHRRIKNRAECGKYMNTEDGCLLGCCAV
jgi:hypothetical protein